MSKLYDDWAAEQHAKRVAHFCWYINSTGRAPKLADVCEVFGFCERDAKPILKDAVMKLAADKRAEA